jgi:flagellar motor switch protein FliM
MADDLDIPDTDAGDDQSPTDFSTGAATAGGERTLNQDEIDSLLGFDINNDEMQDKSGVRAIINSALVSYERPRSWRCFARNSSTITASSPSIPI